MTAGVLPVTLKRKPRAPPPRLRSGGGADDERREVRTWRRGHASADLSALTEPGVQIASLIAAGASNPEIAERLFLSRKTVERHVSNALAKVGVHNRTELAGRLASRSRASE